MERDTKVTELPLVSVCIPVYNASAFIEETLRSLSSQSWKNIEIIAVDDSSTDNSFSILNEYASKEPRLKVLQQANKGAASARNYAFKNSSGGYIKFFDADDLVNKEAIEKQVELLINNPGCVVSGKWGRFYGNDLSTFTLSPESVWKTMAGVDWITESWDNGESMTQPGIFLLPRSLVEKVGMWDESLSLVDDLEFYTKAILNANRVVFCEESILYYRSGLSNNLSGKKSEKAFLSAFSAVEKGCNYLLGKESSRRTKKVAAAALQSIAYSTYPDFPAIYKRAESRVKELGGSSLPYPAGGLTKILVHLFGWKIASRIKKALNK